VLAGMKPGCKPLLWDVHALRHQGHGRPFSPPKPLSSPRRAPVILEAELNAAAKETGRAGNEGRDLE